MPILPGHFVSLVPASVSRFPALYVSVIDPMFRPVIYSDNVDTLIQIGVHPGKILHYWNSSHDEDLEGAATVYSIAMRGDHKLVATIVTL